MNHKSRRINLSGIHAINWYGYSHDYFPVTGNFLLAGVMGSGKSIIMDLIQHVLVGNEKSRYNASATGATSGRTYKGYCLGDLKEWEDVIYRLPGSPSAVSRRWHKRTRTQARNYSRSAARSVMAPPAKAPWAPA